MIFKKVNKLNGELNIPGDKSVSHRSIMLGSLAEGITEVHGFLNGADCISSMNCFRQMGVDIRYDGNIVTIYGNGLTGLKAPAATLDVGNSGTTTRLMSGILAAQPFESRIIGDASICKRPMKRIMTPLRMMGADITSELGNDCAPLIIKGKTLKGIHYDSPVCISTSKILYPSCRLICRWRNKCNRAICITQSYRINVRILRRTRISIRYYRYHKRCAKAHRTENYGSGRYIIGSIFHRCRTYYPQLLYYN